MIRPPLVAIGVRRGLRPGRSCCPETSGISTQSPEPALRSDASTSSEADQPSAAEGPSCFPSATERRNSAASMVLRSLNPIPGPGTGLEAAELAEGRRCHDGAVAAAVRGELQLVHALEVPAQGSFRAVDLDDVFGVRVRWPRAWIRTCRSRRLRSGRAWRCNPRSPPPG